MNLSEHARVLPDTHPKIPSELLRWLSQGLALLHRVADYWTARRQRARELDELYRFTDREFSDVGLSKSDLPAIEKGVYRRE
jgi:uncharacterized protein YjiS (DUF1127 family)